MRHRPIRMEDLLGTCGNAFWDGWKDGRPVNFRYCKNPAMQLFGDRSGIRNQCAACSDSDFGQQLTERFVNAHDVAGAAKWLAGSFARYVDQSLFAYEWAAHGKPLPEVHKHQEWADQTGHIIDAMVTRWADEIRAALRAGQIDPDDIGLTWQDLQPVAVATETLVYA